MFNLIKDQWVAVVALVAGVVVGLVFGGNTGVTELYDETAFTNPIVFQDTVEMEVSLQLGAANAVRCLETFATDGSTTRMYWSANAAGTVVASTTAPTGC